MSNQKIGNEGTNPPGIRLYALAYKFLLIGALSFGGSVIANIRDLVVAREKWLDDDYFLLVMSISEALPGLNSVNSTLLIGDRLAGLGGAIVATIALLLPGTLFVFGLGFAYGMNSDHPLANVILGGVAAGTAALMLYVTWKVGKKTFKQRKSLTIIVLTFVLMSMVKLPLVLVILVVLTLGLYVNRPSSVSTPKEVS